MADTEGASGEVVTDELVRRVVRELGKPTLVRWTSVVSAIEASPILRVCLKKKRVVVQGGWCHGDWKHVVAFYIVGDVAGMGRHELIDYLNGKREAAVLSLLPLLEQAYYDAGPGDWGLTIVSGWWMRETVVRLPGRELTGFIDCSFSFHPHVEPDVVETDGVCG